MAVKAYETNTKNRIIASLILVGALVLFPFHSALAEGETPDGSTTLEVNVTEILSVTVTTPSEWVSGDTGAFLRNTINLDVTSNNSNGFVATMGTKSTAAELSNSLAPTAAIPTLASSCKRSEFPSDRWGYSLSAYPDGTTVGDTALGDDNSIYSPMSSVSSPVTLLSSNSAASGSQSIYLGAKISAASLAGSYAETVSISVVSGAINTTPDEPTAEPTNSQPQASPVASQPQSVAASYSPASTAAATEPEPSDSDILGAAHLAPQGVSEQVVADVNYDNTIASALAITSAVAAASGAVLLILGKRKKDDKEEEEGEA